MISTASSSMSRRTVAGGQRSPWTDSLSRSPVPTPRKKRPGIIAATVAAACATIAGCVRIVGQVTAVPTPTRSVACAIAPSTAHTNGDSPWRVVHGWKWSETVTK